MAAFCFLVALIAALLVSPSLSLSSTSPLKNTPTISAAPTILPDPPLSPNTEISPDIAPLLPSPGSTTTTIPSNPSPPNPDGVSSVGPDPAFAPAGSLPFSSAVNLSLAESAELLKLFSFISFLVVQALAL
ncbi:classical arabinogalactan protein 27-like [Coffea eugenioides]|uniref:classical arabinogalactan protein 27-like n=1 Tax=Coffea eugenioides TaxID=49369 RepID=UPI000F614B4B|nr:classical arabinogalactan protein 27-like [Coffea eugenioides]